MSIQNNQLLAKLQSRIPMLDGLRAISVGLVILYHYGLPVPGGHGVMMFFVLSGFLITWLLFREDETNGRVSLGGFYRRRFFRIVPAFYFYWLSLVVLLLIGGKNIPWPHALSSFFYVSNYYNAIFGDPNTGFSHTWSLSIEEQFYLFWPCVFILLRRDLVRLTRFLVGLIGAFWIYRCVLYFVFHVDQGYFYAAFDTRGDALMTGCLLAVIIKRDALASFWKVVCRNFMMPLMTLALLCTSIYGGPAVFSRYRDVVGFAIDPLLIAIMIVQVLTLSSKAYVRWLDWRVMVLLGQMSYSLYLWQQLTVGIETHLQGIPEALKLFVTFTFTVIVAAFSYFLVEKPLMRFGRRRQSAPVIKRPLPEPEPGGTA